jgi:PIN like domain
MARPRRRSRKRSAASSTAKRLESAVFYLDESIYSRVLAEALEKAGAQIRRPGIDVPFGTADAEWLRLVGAQGWIVLMRDQRARHRPLELEALRAARVAAFVLTAGQASAQQSADVISSKLQKIVNISTSEPRPFVYTLSAGGALARLKLRRG